MTEPFIIMWNRKITGKFERSQAAFANFFAYAVNHLE